MQFVVFPLTLVSSAIRPVVDPLALYIVVDPSTRVYRVISPFIGTLAVFLTFTEVTLIVGTVVPLLLAKTIFYVVEPMATVFTSVFVIISPLALRSILHEVAIIDIAINMIKDPLAICFPLPPLTLIPRTIYPQLTALPMLCQFSTCKGFLHLPLVLRPISQYNLINIYQFLLVSHRWTVSQVAERILLSMLKTIWEVVSAC